MKDNGLNLSPKTIRKQIELHWGTVGKFEKEFGFGREQRAVTRLNEIIEFYKDNGRYPSKSSNFLAERKMGVWISSRRAVIKGIQRGKIYESELDILKKEGCLDLYKETDLEKEDNNKTLKVIKFYKDNNRLPSTKSDNPIEKALGNYISSKRSAMAGFGDSAIYESSIKIAEKNKVPIFIREDSKNKGIQDVMSIIEFTLKNNKEPSSKSKNLKEHKLGRKLSYLRRAKNLGIGTFYEEYQFLANKHGLHSLFNRRQTGERLSKPVIGYNEKESIKYNSISKAARALSCPPGNISRAIKKNQRCRGYYWEYIDE